jgi:hypothetical protein
MRVSDSRITQAGSAKDARRKMSDEEKLPRHSGIGLYIVISIFAEKAIVKI